ncbi:MAG: N-acetylmuramoyl-L-alanine amidase [Polyangiaceae bacterium]
MTRGRSLACVLGGLVVAASCAAPKDAPVDAGSGPSVELASRASRMLAEGAAAPTRAEIVAESDVLAIAAARAGRGEEGGRLASLAAELRRLAFRADHTATDARECVELFKTAAKWSAGTERGCEADRAQALQTGESERGAERAYRELYVAERRQSAVLAAPDASPCVQALRRDQALLVAFRPSDEDMVGLDREANQAAIAYRDASAAQTPVAVPTLSAVAVGSASASPAVDVPEDVVIPSEALKSKGPVKITSVEHFTESGGGRVVVNLSGVTSFHVGALAAENGKDPRIFVDIDRASSRGIARDTTVGGAIHRVRTAPHDDGTRVVLDLASEMHRRVFYLPEPVRVVIDVSSRERTPTAPVSPGSPRVIRRVVLDPGHGGDDAGAIGPTGLREKDVALDIAHRVAPILAHELGIETMLTRDTDVFIPLEERAARANGFHADLFVSIHCNAAENGEARGVESFVLDALKEEIRANSRIAMLENGLKVKSLDPADIDAEMAHVFAGLKSGQVGEDSRTFGALLQRSAMASLSPRYPDTKDHGVKSAAFYVLAGAEMPAVLFETSFISNSDDEARLNTADYRQKLADAIANAIKAFKEGL